MCTLEIPQKIAAQKFLLSTFSYLLLLSLFSNYELFMYFCFCSFFHSYGSFNHVNSTSLSFSEFPVLFLPISSLSQHIENLLHFHLPGVTCDIIMSVLHISLMFFASSCILDVHLVSFHHASSRFLRVPVCSSSGLLLIGPEASHLATIQRWGNT